MHEAASEFVERVSLRLEDYGLSKIAGRMLGYFLIEDQLHSLDELSECLQISKGSASTNARLLERRGLLERRSRPGDRRDFYGLASDPRRNMFEVARDRMSDLKDLFESSAQELPAEMEEARGRLAEWAEFYAFILSDMDRRMKRWDARQEGHADESASA